MATALAQEQEYTISFQEFWTWLDRHHNCIIRVGTPGCLLFDLEDLHWHLAKEEGNIYVVSLCKAKDLIGEIIIPSEDVAFVQMTSVGPSEYLFEVMVETPLAREAVYQFVLSHAYDDERSSDQRRWAH